MTLRTLDPIVLDGRTAEDDIARYIDVVRERPADRDRLVELLPQGHPLYAGRGANQIVRIRGYLLASFETVGLPESALIYAVEALENSQSPYLVAAAAKALRGLPDYAPELASYLVKAITNIQYRDDSLSFEAYKPSWPLQRYTTALGETVETLRTMGTHARPALRTLAAMATNEHLSNDTRAYISEAIMAIESGGAVASSCCCSMPTGKDRLTDRMPGTTPFLHPVLTVELEDQDGERSTYAETFSGGPSVLAFFYTRCGNPNKCSLTVTKLGQLQDRLVEKELEGQIQLAAMTYDPGYDNRERLRGYCENRGFALRGTSRAFRATGSCFDELRDYFNLGAAYSGSLVSRHHIELYVLDEHGQIATTYTNLQWDVEDVLEETVSLLPTRS